MLEPTPRTSPAVTVHQHPHSAARFFELSVDLLCIADTRGRLQRVNPSFQRVLGWPEALLLSRSFYDFVHPADREVTEQVVGQLQTGVSVLSFEHRLIRAGGGHRVVLWTAYPDTRFGVFYAVGRDITQRKRLERALSQRTRELEAANHRLSRLASTDDLTGLPNRRALASRFRQECGVEQDLGLLLVDIDYFKKINDRYGHAEGDDVLARTGDLLRRSVRTVDCPARHGGEEFAVLLPGFNRHRSEQIAERIVQRFRRETWPVCPVTVSVGVACVRSTPGRGDPDATWRQLLNDADSALYRAKREGRNRWASGPGGSVIEVAQPVPGRLPTA